MQTGADKLIAQIAYPERRLMSPLACLTYDQMCQEASASADDPRARRRLSVPALEVMIEERASIYYWVHEEGQLKPFADGYNGELFHDTGIMRAAIQNTELMLCKLMILTP